MALVAEVPAGRKINPLKTEALTKLNLHTALQVGVSLSGGDCFFHSVAQLLNFKFKAQLEAKRLFPMTVKKLRQICYLYAQALEQEHLALEGDGEGMTTVVATALTQGQNWIYQASVPTGQRKPSQVVYKGYLQDVALTAKERRGAGIWGEAHVQGRILCQVLPGLLGLEGKVRKMRILTVEVQKTPSETEGGQPTVTAIPKVVLSTGEESVGADGLSRLMQLGDFLSVIICDNHIEPLFPKEAKAEVINLDLLRGREEIEDAEQKALDHDQIQEVTAIALSLMPAEDPALAGMSDAEEEDEDEDEDEDEEDEAARRRAEIDALAGTVFVTSRNEGGLRKEVKALQAECVRLADRGAKDFEWSGDPAGHELYREQIDPLAKQVFALDRTFEFGEKGVLSVSEWMHLGMHDRPTRYGEFYTAAQRAVEAFRQAKEALARAEVELAAIGKTFDAREQALEVKIEELKANAARMVSEHIQAAWLAAMEEPPSAPLPTTGSGLWDEGAVVSEDEEEDGPEDEEEDGPDSGALPLPVPPAEGDLADDWVDSFGGGRDFYDKLRETTEAAVAELKGAKRALKEQRAAAEAALPAKITAAQAAVDKARVEAVQAIDRLRLHLFAPAQAGNEIFAWLACVFGNCRMEEGGDSRRDSTCMDAKRELVFLATGKILTGILPHKIGGQEFSYELADTAADRTEADGQKFKTPTIDFPKIDLQGALLPLVRVFAYGAINPAIPSNTRLAMTLARMGCCFAKDPQTISLLYREIACLWLRGSIHPKEATGPCPDSLPSNPVLALHFLAEAYRLIESGNGPTDSSNRKAIRQEILFVLSVLVAKTNITLDAELARSINQIFHNIPDKKDAVAAIVATACDRRKALTEKAMLEVVAYRTYPALQQRFYQLPPAGAAIVIPLLKKESRALAAGAVASGAEAPPETLAFTVLPLPEKTDEEIAAELRADLTFFADPEQKKIYQGASKTADSPIYIKLQALNKTVLARVYQSALALLPVGKAQLFFGVLAEFHGRFSPDRAEHIYLSLLNQAAFALAHVDEGAKGKISAVHGFLYGTILGSQYVRDLPQIFRVQDHFQMLEKLWGQCLQAEAKPLTPPDILTLLTGELLFLKSCEVLGIQKLSDLPFDFWTRLNQIYTYVLMMGVKGQLDLNAAPYKTQLTFCQALIDEHLPLAILGAEISPEREAPRLGAAPAQPPMSADAEVAAHAAAGASFSVIPVAEACASMQARIWVEWMQEHRGQVNVAGLKPAHIQSPEDFATCLVEPGAARDAKGKKKGAAPEKKTPKEIHSALKLWDRVLAMMEVKIAGRDSAAPSRASTGSGGTVVEESADHPFYFWPRVHEALGIAKGERQTIAKLRFYQLWWKQIKDLDVSAQAADLGAKNIAAKIIFFPKLFEFVVSINKDELERNADLNVALFNLLKEAAISIFSQQYAYLKMQAFFESHANNVQALLIFFAAIAQNFQWIFPVEDRVLKNQAAAEYALDQIRALVLKSENKLMSLDAKDVRDITVEAVLKPALKLRFVSSKEIFAVVFSMKPQNSKRQFQAQMYRLVCVCAERGKPLTEAQLRYLPKDYLSAAETDALAAVQTWQKFVAASVDDSYAKTVVTTVGPMRRHLTPVALAALNDDGSGAGGGDSHLPHLGKRLVLLRCMQAQWVASEYECAPDTTPKTTAKSFFEYWLSEIKTVAWLLSPVEAEGASAAVQKPRALHPSGILVLAMTTLNLPWLLAQCRDEQLLAARTKGERKMLWLLLGDGDHSAFKAALAIGGEAKQRGLLQALIEYCRAKEAEDPDEAEQGEWGPLADILEAIRKNFLSAFLSDDPGEKEAAISGIDGRIVFLSPLPGLMEKLGVSQELAQVAFAPVVPEAPAAIARPSRVGMFGTTAQGGGGTHLGPTPGASVTDSAAVVAL